MTAPNRNVLWARAIVGELAAGGVKTVCISPGSRSTPLTVALAEHDEIAIYSHLDERSAGFFALGRARRTGTVTPLVCTSGTAAANYHPAVVEASQSRVPLLLLTADRPPELRDSGANQTIDQEKLYTDAVRYYKDLAEPEADARKLRSVRTTIAQALTAVNGTPRGPVHLNVSFKKPLEPTPVPGDVPADIDPVAEHGREDAFVTRHRGVPDLDDDRLRELADHISADKGLIVAGPAAPPGLDPEAVTALAHATGYPVLADPLSNLRYGGHTRVVPVIGGYDGFVGPRLADVWADPEIVIRLGATPTSKSLRKYLATVESDQLLIDPAGEWREAEFTATDLVVADPSRVATHLSRLLDSGTAEWREQWTAAEASHADIVDSAAFHEGALLADVVSTTPEPSTIFVSNSMPVRDLDRFGSPSTASLTILGNRGASGIDGITSSALGAGSASRGELTLVTGDLAFYHDMNGLLALRRCGVEATIVVINNDGGGIFHKLPIEDHDPPFTEQFKTPHGLDFQPAAELYGAEFTRIDARPAADQAAARDRFRSALEQAYATAGSRVIEVRTDAESSHETRESIKERAVEQILE